MQTPYYSFNLSTVGNNYASLENSLPVDKLYYAAKANGELEVLRTLAESDANFEIASPGEYDKLVSLGVDSSRIICSLPIKPVEWLQYLYASGVRYFVFDNEAEYRKLTEYAPDAKKIMRVYIADISENTIEYGLPGDELYNSSVYDKDQIDGITFYLSHNHDIRTLKKVLERCDNLLKVLGPGKILNLGGNYRLENEAGKEFYIELQNEIKRLKNKHNCQVYAETGRSVVKSSGSLITTVQCVKEINGKNYVYIDAGVPTGISYEAKTIEITNREADSSGQELKEYHFFDITCSHRLLFMYKSKSEFKTGDILELKDFGCYSIAKASCFHGWKMPEVKYFD